jgi:hypothetical protein
MFHAFAAIKAKVEFIQVAKLTGIACCGFEFSSDEVNEAVLSESQFNVDK